MKTRMFAAGERDAALQRDALAAVTVEAQHRGAGRRRRRGGVVGGTIVDHDHLRQVSGVLAARIP
jgi:hypothetical protein